MVVSPEAKDLISKMLEKDRRRRLGQTNDIHDIIGHAWFKDINMKQLLNKELKAPYIPKVEDL